MKLELSYDEVSTICHALLLKAEEAATGARECAKLGDMDNDVKFWQERAENYKKVYKAVVAQREQADEEYKQADAAVVKMEGNNEHTVYAGHTGNTPRV